MSYVTYKLLHFTGVFAAVTALAATAMHGAGGGTRADNPHRRALGAAHGIGLVLALVGGFGMLARMGVSHAGLPAWVFAKLGIWFVLGAAIAAPDRGRRAALAVLLGVPLLAVIAGAIALTKPF